MCSKHMHMQLIHFQTERYHQRLGIRIQKCILIEILIIDRRNVV